VAFLFGAAAAQFPCLSEYFPAEMNVTAADTMASCHSVDPSRMRCRRAANAEKAANHQSLSMKCVLTSAHVFMRFAPLKLVSSVRRLVRTQNRGSMLTEHGRWLDTKLCMGGHYENL
jgi:hypothetical protein